MPPTSPNKGKRTQVSRSAGKPRRTPVLLALQQLVYLSDQPHHEVGAHILQALMDMKPNCPSNFEHDFRRLVPLGPQGDINQAWLNDTLLSVGKQQREGRSQRYQTTSLHQQGRSCCGQCLRIVGMCGPKCARGKVGWIARMGPGSAATTDGTRTSGHL